MKGSYSSMEKSTVILQNLKIVLVKCAVVDEKVAEVLKFLGTLNLRKFTGGGGTLHALYILKFAIICGIKIIDQKTYFKNSRLGAQNFLDMETPHNTWWGVKWKTI
jgi:hypothetical protein